MTINKQCSQWDDKARRCMSGHIRTSPTCWGAANSKVVPQCLMDDPPQPLIRDDGMPLGWPEKRHEAAAAYRNQGDQP